MATDVNPSMEREVRRGMDFQSEILQGTPAIARCVRRGGRESGSI